MVEMRSRPVVGGAGAGAGVGGGFLLAGVLESPARTLVMSDEAAEIADRRRGRFFFTSTSTLLVPVGLGRA